MNKWTKLNKKEKKEHIEELKKVKKVVFHDDFGKGFRLMICKRCNFVGMFMGFAMCGGCDTTNKRYLKTYSIDKLQDFILDTQEVIIKLIKKCRKLEGKKK